MAKQLKHYPRKDLNAYFERHMVKDTYSFDEMLCLYTDLFSRKGIYGVFKPMREDSLRGYLRELRLTDNSFLTAKSAGDRVVYLKRPEPLPIVDDYLDELAFCDKIKMSPLYKDANALYAKGSNKVKSWWN